MAAEAFVLSYHISVFSLGRLRSLNQGAIEYFLQIIKPLVVNILLVFGGGKGAFIAKLNENHLVFNI